jgi:hypothetical protein
MLRNCTRRKTEIRIHEVLPNGQHLNLYFIRKNPQDPQYPFYQWKVGLCITETRKEANKWWSKDYKKMDGKQTGTCGLAGLKRALDCIMIFTNRLNHNEELTIGWGDLKRQRAYRYLLRKGFIEYRDDDDEVKELGIRNPAIWQFIE